MYAFTSAFVFVLFPICILQCKILINEYMKWSNKLNRLRNQYISTWTEIFFFIFYVKFYEIIFCSFFICVFDRGSAQPLVSGQETDTENITVPKLLQQYSD